jgi:SPX domain protein involved in polyphosphate accumulation
LTSEHKKDIIKEVIVKTIISFSFEGRGNMAIYNTIFKRVEKKYRTTEDACSDLLSKIGDRLYPDRYGKSTVCNLYLDTPDFLLIRNSIDAVSYKEKLRVRSYGLPKKDGTVFFEIKKRKEGRGGCSCGGNCGACGMNCHGDKTAKK